MIVATEEAYLAWRPRHLASTQNVDMNVKHLLATIFAIVNHNTVSLGQVLLSCNFFGNYKKMAQQLNENKKNCIMTFHR